MHRNSISTERVNNQNIQIILFLLLQFPFEGEAPIAGDHLDSGRRITEKGEVSLIPRDSYDVRVDFIIAHNVSRLTVCGNRANAEPQDTDP